MRRSTLAWALLLFLPAARADQAVGALPFTATLSNRYYLASDVTVPAGSMGFVVGADNVTLDLNGHTITCAGGVDAGTRAVFVLARSHFTLGNGRIRDCDYGVDTESGPERPAHVRIENVQLAGSYRRGIRLVASDSEIRNSRIEDTNDGAATVAGQPAIAIEVSGPRNVIRNNSIVDVKAAAGEGVGIALGDVGAETLVADNLLLNRPEVTLDYGIRVDGESSPRMTGNTIAGFSAGIAASPSTRGLIRNNTVVGADVAYDIDGPWTDGGNNY